MGMAGGLEALHDPLTLAGRLVGILGAVVQIAALAVLHTRQHLALGRAITGELVGDELW